MAAALGRCESRRTVLLRSAAAVLSSSSLLQPGRLLPAQALPRHCSKSIPARRRKLENPVDEEACSLPGIRGKPICRAPEAFSSRQSCSEALRLAESAESLAPQTSLLCWERACGEVLGVQPVMLQFVSQTGVTLPNIPNHSSISVKEPGKYFIKHFWDFSLVVVMSSPYH